MAMLCRSDEFDDATFDRFAASFDTPDHVAIVVHDYRWRLSLAEGEPKYGAREERLADAPVITVPTIPSKLMPMARLTPDPRHRLIKGGIGHNQPQEAPQAFAEAVIDAAKSWRAVPPSVGV
jgi:hypothetical protein